MIREKHIVESDKLSVSVSIYINRTNWPFELVGEQLGHKFFNLKSKDSLYRTRKPADRCTASLASTSPMGRTLLAANISQKDPKVWHQKTLGRTVSEGPSCKRETLT